MAQSGYGRWGRRQARIAARSDRNPRVELPAEALPRLRRMAASLAAPLQADDRIVLERRAARFVLALLSALRVPPVGVRVHASRPRQAGSELHGLYVREPGKRPLVHVWMRTAVRGQPVRFRTFLRTLLHEVCHHLDYEWLRLPDSLHTRGFYQRESSLMRQLVPPARAARRRATGAPARREAVDEVMPSRARRAARSLAAPAARGGSTVRLSEPPVPSAPPRGQLALFEAGE